MTSFESTAYGPPWDAMNGTGITATGVDLTSTEQKLVVAADPSVLPMGTKITISPNPFNDTSLVFTVCDTGGAIIGNHNDIFIASGRAAQDSWGVRTVNVNIVGHGSPSDVAVLGSAGSAVAGGGLGTAPGGTAGLGGSGTSPNTTSGSPFTVGDTSNPNEDYWTAINRLAQDRNWYLVADGETLYLADGPDLIAQKPVVTVDRFADAGRIQSLSFNFDNSAFSWASTHTKSGGKIQRASTLAKVSSPTQGSLSLICEIDEIRAGDVIFMSSCGPGDGRWLVSDCTRSIFEVASQITLVPALAPLTEQEVAGANSNAGSPTGSGTGNTTPGAPGSPTTPSGTPNSHGVVNPIPGFSGFTFDDGIDCAAPVGSPILAPAACSIVAYAATWYAGQYPLVLYKFDQPLAGAPTQYWYVSEGIKPTSTTIGMHFSQGATTATYTGPPIEIGWGDPSQHDYRYAQPDQHFGTAHTGWGWNFYQYFGVGT